MTRAPSTQSGRVTPEYIYDVTMREHKLRFLASDYEHAVVRLEVWCIDNGVERSGAEFVRGDRVDEEGAAE